MQENLRNLKVAIIVDDGFEQVEMTEPRKALEAAGAKTEIISPQRGKVKGWKQWRWGDWFSVNKTIENARPSDYDALLLPGGSKSADKLRKNKDVVSFVKKFYESDKPIAAICHAPWILAEAGIVKGKRITSYPAIEKDMKKAGAKWSDEPVVLDHNLVTSRKPKDIPHFNEKMIEEFAERVEMTENLE